jgi:hypothetical protein
VQKACHGCLFRFFLGLYENCAPSCTVVELW